MNTGKNGIATITREEFYDHCTELKGRVEEALDNFHNNTGVRCGGITLEVMEHIGMRGRDALVMTHLEIDLEEDYEQYLKQEEPELPNFNDDVARDLIVRANSLFVGLTFKYAMQSEGGDVTLYEGVPAPLVPGNSVRIGKFQEHPNGWTESLYKCTK